MLKSSLCDDRDAYIFVSGTITVEPQAKHYPNNVNKKVVFENCDPFTDCISGTNNTQIENAKDIEVVMPMYNLLEHSDNYSKASGSLRQYYRDEPALSNASDIPNFSVVNNSTSFKSKEKITSETAAGVTKKVEIMVLLKYLSNFWRTLEMAFN